MKSRILSWLSDCAASIALMALAAILLGAPPPAVVATDAAAYLSSAGAAEAVKQRLIRGDAIRGLRSGRSAADRPSASWPGLQPSPAGRAPLRGPLLFSAAASGEIFALARAHHRPAPTGPPRFG